MVAFDPKRKADVRLSKVEEFEFVLDVSALCQGDRRAALSLISGMPETFEQIKVLVTVEPPKESRDKNFLAMFQNLRSNNPL